MDFWQKIYAACGVVVFIVVGIFAYWEIIASTWLATDEKSGISPMLTSIECEHMIGDC